MLETVDLTPSLEKEDYAARRPNYDRELFDLVRRARAANVSIVLVFEGTELAGKGQAIYTLTEKLDPRVATVHPTTAARKFERERPWLWRFWMKLPGRGEISVFDESWYRRVLVERFDRHVIKAECRAAYEEIVAFERTLVDDGIVLVKLFLHIDRKTQRKRLRKLMEKRDGVQPSWKKQQRRWNEWEDLVEAMLERTATPEAPWHIVPACCNKFSRAKVFETVIGELRRALDDRNVPGLAPPTAASKPGPAAPRSH